MNEVASQRIAITGLGVVSACGIGCEAFEESLREGRSGIGPIDIFPGEVPPGHIGGQCRDFNDSSAKKQYLRSQRKSIKVMCRDIQLGVASASLALQHSNLELNEEQRARLGVEFGADLMLSNPDVLSPAAFAARDETGVPTDTCWGDRGIPQMEPLWLLKYLPNMPACHISIHADARGPSNSLTLEDASGNLTLGESLRIIRRGQADAMIAGTTGARLHIVKSINYMNLHELADPAGGDPAKVLRPFDKNRSGEVVGEGSGTLILEEASLAESRGAKIYGWVRGIGSSCVRSNKQEGNVKQALVNSIKAALKSAGVEAADIGHVNANGSGSVKLDAAEAAAIHEAFGDYGAKIPVVAYKPYFGNCGSGTGTLEMIASLLGMQNGILYPTLNCESPDPECNLNVVTGEPAAISNKLFINLNVTRNGQASALVMESA
ncbi:beta-ketoacyl-[acyl-carrier-protein] synthase family protein [Rubinisphaera sp. JC750]|uniref:beta-ketoacyl-[acyl-carrier-protein] synthase family protein n=1 Tax=Rubinisphaera sp. JC750 TaxID=2898658 RepID=UPI001F25B6BF|nr:beta-ketoacyl synthase N-terminal-like domain-containing protein [Rubinisphaera sp. JC750]